MPSQGHHASAFPEGYHYVVYPDGAFTMPMSRKAAQHVVRVFGGHVKTDDPTILRLRQFRDLAGRALAYLTVAAIALPLGYYGTAVVGHLLVGYGIAH